MKRNGSAPKNESSRPHPLEVVLEQVSAESSDDPDEVARENAWAHAVRQKVDTQLAALRRQLNPARSTPRRAARISDELLVLDRDCLLARLAILRQAPEVRISHLELSGLTTDDLRQLVAEIEAMERPQT
jgi:hypothetical protein